MKNALSSIEVDMQPPIGIEISLLSLSEQIELDSLYEETSNGLDGLDWLEYQQYQNHLARLERYEEEDYLTKVCQKAAESEYSWM